jgi:hypothetical protein
MLPVLPKVLFPQQKELVTYNIFFKYFFVELCHLQNIVLSVTCSLTGGLMHLSYSSFLRNYVGVWGLIFQVTKTEYSPLFCSPNSNILQQFKGYRNNKIASVFLVTAIFKPAHDSNPEIIPLSSCLFFSRDVEVLKMWYMPLCSTE